MKFDEFNCDENIAMNIQHEIIGYNIGAIVHSVSSTISNSNDDNKRYQRYSATRQVGENSWIKNTTNSFSHGATINRLCSFWIMEDMYQLIDIESIEGPAAVYVDSNKHEVNNKNYPGMSCTIYSIDIQSKWHLRFLDYDSEELKLEASCKRDDNFEEEDIRFPYEG